MGRCPLIAAVLVAAAVTASAASAIESTIVRGVGIGKVKVGMTRAEVERIFGTNALVNMRTRVDGTTYLELGWNFGTWSVGFVEQGATYRVAQVATGLKAQRTDHGIGVGSSFKVVARAYPQAVCREYFVSMGSSTEAGPSRRSSSSALVVAGDRKQLAFLVRPAKATDRYGLWFVYEVIVRNTIPGAVDYVPRSHCDPDWRQLERPYRSDLPQFVTP